MLHLEQTTLASRLMGALVGLARATEGNDHLLSAATAEAVVDGLLAVSTGTAGEITALLERVDGEKRKLVPDCYHCLASCGRTSDYDMDRLQSAPPGIRRMKITLLSHLQQAAVKIREAGDPAWVSTPAPGVLYKALYALGMEDWAEEELLPILAQTAALAGGEAAFAAVK